MANSYTSLTIHYVFSVKDRAPLLKPDIYQRLISFVGGIAKKHNMHLVTMGGTQDHVHILLDLPADLSVAKAVQMIKGGTSRWIRESIPQATNFRWQTGYGAFSVSKSQIPEVKAYIANQEEHHTKRSFQEEFRALLKKHKVAFEEQYLP